MVNLFWLLSSFINAASIPRMTEIGSVATMQYTRGNSNTIAYNYTGGVMVERSPTEREVVSSSHNRIIPKIWKCQSIIQQRT